MTRAYGPVTYSPRSAGSVPTPSPVPVVEQRPTVYAATVVPGEWTSVPAVSRLRIAGNGTLTVDARNRAGTVRLGVFRATVASATRIAFPWYGADTVEIRASVSGTLSVEVF